MKSINQLIYESKLESFYKVIENIHDELYKFLQHVDVKNANEEFIFDSEKEDISISMYFNAENGYPSLDYEDGDPIRVNYDWSGMSSKNITEAENYVAQKIEEILEEIYM